MSEATKKLYEACMVAPVTQETDLLSPLRPKWVEFAKTFDTPDRIIENYWVTGAVLLYWGVSNVFHPFMDRDTYLSIKRAVETAQSRMGDAVRQRKVQPALAQVMSHARNYRIL